MRTGLSSAAPAPRRAVLVMPGCAMAAAPRFDPPAPSAATDGREVFERFVELLYRQRRVRQAFECCVVASGYVDHAAGGYPSRAQALQGLRRRLADPALHIEVLHTLYDGDAGMVHLRVREPSADGTPVERRRVEIYRVAGGRLVEHWSVAP